MARYVCTCKLGKDDGSFVIEDKETGRTYSATVIGREMAQTIVELMRKAGWEIKVE